jgi:hypothetical protein
MATAVPTQVTEYQTGFAPQLAPYAEKLLGRAEFYTNPSDPANQYQQYVDASGKPVQRVAQFTPLQQQSYTNAQNLGYDPYSVAAAQGMYGAAQQAMNYGYNPQQYSNQYQAPAQYNPGQFSYNQAYAPNVNQYQMQGPQQARGITALSANQGRAPTSTAQQLIAAPRAAATTGTSTAATAAQLGAAPEQVGFNQVKAPQLRDLSMNAARDISTDSFAKPGSADAYMSPYMQSVVGVQQREAQRAADIATQSRNAQAVQAGGLGGSRRAIMDAEAARNLATQKGDIQATGSQAAYQQAQAQFNAEQTARLQAATSNQGVQQQANLQNLSAQLQQQGLGAQTGMQAQQLNQSAGVQTGLANQALQGQYGLQQGQMNQQTGMANQQYANQFGLSNQAAQNQMALANQALAGQYGLQQGQFGQQTGLANQALAGQYGMQQGQFGQQANMQTAQNQQQAMLANQQMGYNVGNQNLQAMLATQQLGSGQNMQAQLANQQAGMTTQQNQQQANQYGYGQQMASAQNAAQYGQAANQLNAQNAQYGAGLGLQGLQAGMTGYNNLGSMGSNLYNQNIGNMNAQNTFGTQQQNQAQNVLTNNYQDFLNQQNYPYKQMSFMSDMLRGAPLSQTGSSVYQAPPSMLSQVGGLGAMAYGQYLKAPGGKHGGAVKSYASGGLVQIALQKIMQD